MNTKKPDWLPTGEDQPGYVNPSQQWPGLEKRLGQPRILANPMFPEIERWIAKEFGHDSRSFSFFDAGCGHGNDLRAIKEFLAEEYGISGQFLGADISEAEILHGLKYYGAQGEDTKEAVKLFMQGDLRNLRSVNFYNQETGKFSRPGEIKSSQFAVIHTEAVLHGLGYGGRTYVQKRNSAQLFLDEMKRICRPGGKFFGRANVFSPSLTKDERLEALRKANDWRFIPTSEELEEMINVAGFVNLKVDLQPHEKVGINPERKYYFRFSFLAQRKEKR